MRGVVKDPPLRVLSRPSVLIPLRPLSLHVGIDKGGSAHADARGCWFPSLSISLFKFLAFAWLDESINIQKGHEARSDADDSWLSHRIRLTSDSLRWKLAVEVRSGSGWRVGRATPSRLPEAPPQPAGVPPDCHSYSLPPRMSQCCNEAARPGRGTWVMGWCAGEGESRTLPPVQGESPLMALSSDGRRVFINEGVRTSFMEPG